MMAWNRLWNRRPSIRLFTGKLRQMRGRSWRHFVFRGLWTGDLQARRRRPAITTPYRLIFHAATNATYHTPAACSRHRYIGEDSEHHGTRCQTGCCAVQSAQEPALLVSGKADVECTGGIGRRFTQGYRDLPLRNSLDCAHAIRVRGDVTCSLCRHGPSASWIGNTRQTLSRSGS